MTQINDLIFSRCKNKKHILLSNNSRFGQNGGSTSGKPGSGGILIGVTNSLIKHTEEGAKRLKKASPVKSTVVIALEWYLYAL